MGKRLDLHCSAEILDIVATRLRLLEELLQGGVVRLERLESLQAKGEEGTQGRWGRAVSPGCSCKYAGMEVGQPIPPHPLAWVHLDRKLLV